MKLLTYLFTLFFVFNAIAVAPYGIKGQAQSGTLYSNVHQFPNSQVTNTGGINALVETGNKQILTNPSFEHATFSTGWTNSAGTFVQDTVVEIDGLKAAKLTLASQAMSLTQDSTLYASQFADGVQGLAMVRIKTAVSGLRVCPRQAGVINSNLCVSVVASGKWGLYKVPFTLGGTSNGISIDSNSVAVTGDVYIDDAFVGAVDLSATVDQSRFLGTVLYTTGGTNTTGWRNYTGSGSVSSGSGISFNNTTKEITLEQSGDYKIDFFINYAASTAGSGIASGLTVNGVTEQCIQVALGGADTGPRPKNTCNLKNLPANSKIILRQYTSTALGGDNAQVDIFRFATGNTYSSTNADFGMTSWTPTGTWTGTTYTGTYRRKGQYLIGEVKAVTSGAVTGTLNITLPTHNGVQLQADVSKYPDSNEARVGYGTVLDNAVNRYAIDVGFASTTALVPLTLAVSTGSQIANNVGVNATLPITFGASDAVSFNFMVPIVGWEESSIIIGQFNGLESCTDTYQCTDTYSAKVSATGVVSDENIDWISGNCSTGTTGFKVCTFRTNLFTVSPNCQMVMDTGATNGFLTRISSSSAGSVTFLTMNTGAIPVNEPFQVMCQKQGVDYIGKTAKAVASDQNLRTPGITKSIIFSAVFAGSTEASTCATNPCTLYNNRGGIITGVTRTSTGIYSISTTGLSGNAPTCTYSTKNFSGSASTSCYSASVRSLTTIPLNCLAGGTAIDAAIEIVCHGETP